MRVIVLGPSHPLRGGIANTSESLCRALNAAGAEATIVSYKLQYPKLLFPGKTQYTSDPAPEGLVIESLVNSVNPANWAMTARRINRYRPDLVIARYWLPFLAPCLGTICRLVNRSTTAIGMTDNIIPHEKRIGDTQLTRYFINSCDAFAALSSSVEKELREFTAKPVTYLPHPINDNVGAAVEQSAARAHLELDPDGRYLLFFGLVRKYKGLDLLLHALADERVRSLNVKLLIVGEFYDDPAYYTAMIDKLGINDAITIRNEFIPSDEVKYYFSAVDMIAQTYHTASQSGITQVAYNFHCPMLVTDVGGLSEIVPHGRAGYVVDKTPAAIAAAIADFYERNRAAEFAANIAVEKQRFTWETFVANLLTFYEDVKVQ